MVLAPVPNVVKLFCITAVKLSRTNADSLVNYRVKIFMAKTPVPNVIKLFWHNLWNLLAKDKHSNLLGPIISCEENEVLWMKLLAFIPNIWQGWKGDYRGQGKPMAHISANINGLSAFRCLMALRGSTKMTLHSCWKRKAESGKRKVESGKWKVESGKWKAESRKRKAESGKRICWFTRTQITVHSSLV